MVFITIKLKKELIYKYLKFQVYPRILIACWIPFITFNNLVLIDYINKSINDED